MINQPIESNLVNGISINKGTKLYYARILGVVGMCYVQTLTVRTIYEDMIVGIEETTKNAQVLSNNLIGESVFINRKQALTLVKNAEKSGKIRKFKENDIDK